MADSEQSENLFAQELVQILAEHGLELAQLANVGIEATTIERLESSLHNSQFSPVLSPDEMELLVTGLLIDATEQGRLKAALLAMAVRRLLKDQLGPTYASQITSKIYDLVLDASLKADLGTLGDSVRGQGYDSREDRTWAVIWEAMDAADMALGLSRGISKAVQMSNLREARSRLEEALEALDSLKDAMGSSPTWLTNYKKASKDLKTVNRRLRLLETKK
jgi:hypothetical protein